MFFNSNFDPSTSTMEQPLPYNTVETLLEDVSRQMASSNLSRRCSQKGSRPGSMRIVKTSSASNSPRNSSGLNRRRTLMADYQYRRQPTMADQKTLGQADLGASYENIHDAGRSSRPLSWHPSSQLPGQENQMAYPIPTIQLNGPFNQYQLPPTPAVFSGYASPVSTLSQTSQPFTAYEHDQNPFFSDVGNLQPANFESSNALYVPFIQSTPLNYHMDDFSVPMDNPMGTSYSQFGWSNFAASDFNSATAPPTPDNFLPIQHPSPSFETEESIPYNPLEESEPTGEILVGMGLYDTPEKPAPSDPQLDNYRALLMTQLLGPSHRTYEPSGKGLKLEETWAPASDDGEGEDDDNDADGDEEDEEGEGEEDDDDDDGDTQKTADSFQPEDYAKDIAPTTADTNHHIPEYHLQDFRCMAQFGSNPLQGQQPHGHYHGTTWI